MSPPEELLTGTGWLCCNPGAESADWVAVLLVEGVGVRSNTGVCRGEEGGVADRLSGSGESGNCEP